MSGDPVGTLAEEAARLAEAVHRWAGERAGQAPGAGATDARSWSDRIAGDHPECQICPLCQVVTVVRGARPEVVEHLADAATSIAAALRELATPGPSEGGAAGERDPRGPVEHIDIG